MSKLVQLYRRLHWGDDPGYAPIRLAVGDSADVVELGELIEVVYETAKGTRESVWWKHRFAPRRPLLCVTPDDRRLVIAGGDYTVTERGIVR